MAKAIKFRDRVSTALKNGESEWTPLASINVESGRLAVSDAMLFRDTNSRLDFPMPPGTYVVLFRSTNDRSDSRITRLRISRNSQAQLGNCLGWIGVDFSVVGIFDPVAADRADSRLKLSEKELLSEQFETEQSTGIVHVAGDSRAVIPFVRSGFGDGVYPVYELCSGSRCSGLEVIFIGPEAIRNQDVVIVP